MPTPSNSMETQFRCTIKYMFKGCPKQDGWFGCFAQIRGGDSIKLTGKTMLPLVKGMQLDVTAVKTGDDEYNVSDITIVTRTLTGAKAYLMSLPGISEPTAKRMVQVFGSNAIDEIRNNPDHVKTILGLKDRQMKALIEGVNGTDEINQIRTFLPELYTDAVNYIKKNIPSPKQAIQANPWILLQCPHTSFQVVDTIAIRLGIDPFSEERIERGIMCVLESMQSGDNYLNLSNDNVMMDFMLKVQSLLRIKFGMGMTEFGNRLMTMACRPEAQIFIRQYGREFHLYTMEDWRDYQLVKEQILATCGESYVETPEQASRMKTMLTKYAAKASMRLTDEQNYAVIIALSKKLSVITGGPGRGKTYTVSYIAGCNALMPEVMDPVSPKKAEILLLAPTGRAAKKLEEGTDGKYPTMTIDRLICEAKAELKTIGKKHRKAPVIARYNKDSTLIIVDESSMIEMPKIADLFRYFGNARYCFVGDKDQLPPVGKGQFFHDLIKCGKIAVAQLTIPIRNTGLIMQNADKINAGDTSLTYDLYDMPFLPQMEDDQTALDAIIDQYNDERAQEPDESQIAIICPIKKGSVGVISINLALQEITCPENPYGIASYNGNHAKNYFTAKGYPIPDTYYGQGQQYTRFRVGDTVMCTKSDYSVILKEYKDNDYWNGSEIESYEGIFNGDVGKIIGYIAAHAVGNDTDSDYIVVQFTNGYVAELDRANEQFDHFVLGYAMTVHKVQGCEYNTVVYVSPKSLKGLTRTGFACRNLAYTAVTRAKKRVVVIGSKESLNACIETEMSHRNSTLAEELSV